MSRLLQQLEIQVPQRALDQWVGCNYRSVPLAAESNVTKVDTNSNPRGAKMVDLEREFRAASIELDPR